MTKPTGKPKGRPPGRPKGSRDFRPHLLNLLERFKLIPVLLEELEALKESLPPKEKVQLYLELARMGLLASPKTVDVDSGVGIALYVNGIRQNRPIDQTGEPTGERPPIEITPLPRALPPPATSRDKRPHTPSRPRPVDATPEDDSSPPPGTQIFRVPSIDDDGPPEWREPLFPKGRSD